MIVEETGVDTVQGQPAGEPQIQQGRSRAASHFLHED